ncbi:uncharacterized protein F4807DRAFT_472171 [Annulohypoxylon truncatum]|uniref:uncharacterized protein n=1 Tax=Annulohypoxylon truncatum TaxID=327061 RepID=UPI002007B563|nr:uncharacterized protein F4807DRAFT_472171 [Annulohypoxylon truncatum]KAI1212638.1 hypothetical protein F4807DRAFT_472171 [Annulohypoxylon truncatum]
MGAAISAVYTGISDADEQESRRTKQDLEVLQRAVEYKLDQFDSKLTEMFLNSESSSRIQVPGLRALRKSRFTSVGIRGTPSENVSKAIDDYLSTGSAKPGTGEDIKNGFKKIVSSALDRILSTTSAGEHELHRFFVYVQHNAIIRLDVMLWRWNFTGKGFSDKYENALGYLICTSVVDVSALKTAEFVYLISEYAGDSDEDVIRYVKAMEDLYSRSRKLKLSQQHPSQLEDDD